MGSKSESSESSKSSETQALSPHDSSRLRHCESVITSGAQAYYSMGRALAEIQKDRLYRAEYSTFDEYTERKWGMKRGTAYRCIRAAIATRQLVESKETEGFRMPTSEGQVRPLTTIDEEIVPQVWAKACQDAGDRAPTARHVEAAARALSAPQENDRQAETTPREVLHSSDSNEWGTPAYVLASVRDMFGGLIDLDPASSEAFAPNVAADTYWTQTDDGLSKTWHGNVFCNPPYGRRDGNASSQGVWLKYAISQVDNGNANAVAFLCNAQIGRSWLLPAWQHLVCVFNDRLRFLLPDLSVGAAPTNGNLLVLITNDPRAWYQRFAGAFSSHGVIAPCLSAPEKLRAK